MNHSIRLWAFIIALSMALFSFTQIELIRNAEPYVASLESMDYSKLKKAKNVTISEISTGTTYVYHYLGKKSEQFTSVLQPVMTAEQLVEMSYNISPEVTLVVKHAVPEEITGEEALSAWVSSLPDETTISGSMLGKLEADDKEKFESAGVHFTANPLLISSSGHQAPSFSLTNNLIILATSILVIVYGLMGFWRSVQLHQEIRLSELKNRQIQEPSNEGKFQNSVVKVQRGLNWKLAVEDALSEHFHFVNAKRFRDGVIRDLFVWPIAVRKLILSDKNDPEATENPLNLPSLAGRVAIWLPATFIAVLVALGPLLAKYESLQVNIPGISFLLGLVEWLLLARYTPLGFKRAFYVCFLLLFAFVTTLQILPEYVATNWLGIAVESTDKQDIVFSQLPILPWLPLHVLASFWIVGYVTWTCFRFFLHGWTVKVAGRDVVMRNQ